MTIFDCYNVLIGGAGGDGAMCASIHVILRASITASLAGSRDINHVNKNLTFIFRRLHTLFSLMCTHSLMYMYNKI